MNLSHIMTQIRGLSYSKKDSYKESFEGAIPVLRAGNIQDSKILEEDYVYVSNDLVKNKQYLKHGDVLIAASSGSISIVGKAAMIDYDMNATFGAFCKVLRPSSEKINIDYFKHFFVTAYYKRTIKSLAEGANINNLKTEHFDDLEIPLPPLDQQKKIAAILDAADAYRQKTKALIKKYDELTQSLFLDMFGDPVTNPKGWEVKTLSDFIKSLNTGVSVNSTDKKYTKGNIGILKTSCVYTGIFRDQEAKVIREDEYGRMKLNPTADSIIISRMNTTELVGKSAYISRDYNELYLPDRLWLSEKGELSHNTRWLSHSLSFKSFMNEISKISSGTSGSMKNISKKNYLNLSMIYPALELQNQFAERVQAIEVQKAQAEASLAQAEDLFNSLLQRAFKGELSS